MILMMTWSLPKIKMPPFLRAASKLVLPRNGDGRLLGGGCCQLRLLSAVFADVFSKQTVSAHPRQTGRLHLCQPYPAAGGCTFTDAGRNTPAGVSDCGTCQPWYSNRRSSLGDGWCVDPTREIITNDPIPAGDECSIGPASTSVYLSRSPCLAVLHQDSSVSSWRIPLSSRCRPAQLQHDDYISKRPTVEPTQAGGILRRSVYAGQVTSA